MKKIILALLGLFITSHLMAAESVKLDQFLPKLDSYRFTNHMVVIELTIQTNVLRIASNTDTSKRSASAMTWKAGKDWFVFVGKNQHVWAGDGNNGYWFLTATAHGATVKAMELADEAPPVEVAKRLPKAILRALPSRTLPH
jgi:hypothetical protein